MSLVDGHALQCQRLPNVADVLLLVADYIYCSSCYTFCTSLALLTWVFVGFCLCITRLISIGAFVSSAYPLHCHLTLLFPLVTGLLMSLPIWLFRLSDRMMHFLSVLCIVFAFFTTTLPLSLKLSSLLFPLEVACGSCYCRRCIVLLVGTLVLERPPMLYCRMFGGLVCLVMCLLLFGFVLFASTQSLAL